MFGNTKQLLNFIGLVISETFASSLHATCFETVRANITGKQRKAVLISSNYSNMLKKLKKIDQMPVEAVTIEHNIVEVVSRTQSEALEGDLTKSQNRLSTKRSAGNLVMDRNDKSKILSHRYDTNNNNNENFKNSTNMAGNTDCSVNKGAKVTKCVQFKDSEKNVAMLVTDVPRKAYKYTAITCRENPSERNNNRSDSSSQSSVAIDKQLSAAGTFKKVKCVFTILNSDQISVLRKHAQEAVKQNKIFIIRGNYNSIRQALITRGWVEKLEIHRKAAPFAASQINICDLSQVLPKRKMGETQRQFIAKVERSIMSRYIENVLCDFLWTPHKEKADHVEQSKNPSMLINKFNRAPFTNKENLNSSLHDIAAFYEEGVAEIRFPRCFNVWSLDELNDFIDNFKLTASIAFLNWIVDKFTGGGFDAVFSPNGKIPFNAIDFAFKRCLEYIDACQHNDIDIGDPSRIWEHDWDAFLHQHHQLTHEGLKILADPQNSEELVVTRASQILNNMKYYWPQHTIDGYQNLWIIKPANKCRGRGIHLSNNLKKILNFVNPSIAAKSRFVVQKYMERPLIIHQTKFDIRQWFLISSVQPLMIWMYKDCYLRFSSQEFTLSNHHESVHLTNHAIQKKYTNNGKRDKRLPSENMWDSYSFQAYLRQIGKQEHWLERIYPGMRKAIVAAVLVSQDHMERTSNTFELFGADFMVCENFYPWLIEINSNPDLAATTSVTARMCPQCLEDVVKVIIDRRSDAKADVGNFELIYRQNIPATPAYMGLNIIVKGKQIGNRTNGHQPYFCNQRKEKSLHTSQFYKQRTSSGVTNVSQAHKPMPSFNATDYVEKSMTDVAAMTPRSRSVSSLQGSKEKKTCSMTHVIHPNKRRKSLNNPYVAAAGSFQPKISCPKSTLCSSFYTTIKRNRSCGPRLSANFLLNCPHTQKSNFCVAPQNQLQQSAVHSSRYIDCIKRNTISNTPALAISKSMDNIKELCSPLKRTLKFPETPSPPMPVKKTLSNCRSQLRL